MRIAMGYIWLSPNIIKTCGIGDVLTDFKSPVIGIAYGRKIKAPPKTQHFL
jgi:hypothetical protein